MFEQVFRNVDNVLFTDQGADNELDYIGQTSWVLFLKYLDQLEHQKADEAALQGRQYTYMLLPEFRWSTWAVPRKPDGSVDHNRVKTGDDLIDFVEDHLWPYLQRFKAKAPSTHSLEYRIGEIFTDLSNKVHSGYNLREVINHIDELEFHTSEQKHELSELYEAKIKRMGNAGRNGGQYYTPRPLIRAMIKVIDPQVGETIYDGAAGSAGFLVEAYEYLMRNRTRLSTEQLETIQRRTLYGKESKVLAYTIGVMNMILHGIESPNYVHTNTLTEPLQDIQEKDRFNIILANPPFGGSERAEVLHNFPIKTSETAFLFLQHFIKRLRAGGRAAIVIKNTFLSNMDNAAIALRRHLLETCDLHTVLDMPQGTFQGAGVKTVVLFFTKGRPTQRIWYYQLNPGRSMGKTNALNDADMADFLAQQPAKAESPQSWAVAVADVDAATMDLSVKNPNAPAGDAIRTPQEILAEIEALDAETNDLLASIKEML